MLEKIDHIRGVGLFHEANGSQHPLRKVTLIYSDNGRGKSTLSSILRSVSKDEVALIGSRRTIDGSQPPSIALQFSDGHTASFSGANWSERRSELLVFDSDFVDKNVYSGSTVSTDHRKNLLDFALGERAVVVRAEVEQHTDRSKVEAGKIKTLSDELKLLHLGTTLSRFQGLPLVEDADTLIRNLRDRISAAESAVAINGMPIPTVIPEFTLDLQSLFSLFEMSLEDVHNEVARNVHAHIKKSDIPGIEKWLSEGSKFDSTDSCPYCGQDISTNELVKAYRQYFTATYAALKLDVEILYQELITTLAPVVISTFVQGVASANAILSTWARYGITKVISFDSALSASHLASLQSLLVDLAKQKLGNPAESVGNDSEKLLAADYLRAVIQLMYSANDEIINACATIATFRGSLASENVENLKDEIKVLEWGKSRHTPEVVNLFDELASAQRDLKTSDDLKSAARERLNAIMSATLVEYRTTINDLLRKFGTSFSIGEMTTNYRGTAPRSDYALKLRGKAIPLEGGSPTFETALSEGDKRTLAFAFFVASALRHPTIGQCVVIVDDPISSLDLNRKAHTRGVLMRISGEAEQIIVLSHDRHFLRDLRDAIPRKKRPTLLSLLQIKPSPNNYSDFGDFDIDRECESPFYQHHRLLVDYLETPSGDPNQIAKAIRPMLEGHLHRRFPHQLSHSVMFGTAINEIENATAPSPLVFAKSLITELRELNEYAKQFHHDADDGAPVVTTNHAELTAWAERALAVVSGGTP